jgi:site-specific recombinase XerD
MSTTGPGSGEVDDPVGYFLQDVAYHGKSDRTIEAYARVLRRFESFLQDPDQNHSGTSAALSAATHRDCMAWVHEIRGDVAESTVATYASYLHRFYAYMTQVGAFESNPMALVVEEMNETIDKDPTRREISIEEMRAFVGGISHPLERAVVVTLLKTGMRVGELCNLDLRDLRLSGAAAEAYDLGTRPQLDGRGESLYVAADVDRGEVVNREERSAANKRKRTTVVPVDDELSAVLTRWLAIRPDAVSAADPLFVSTSREWGRRLTPQMVRNAVETHAREAGWYRTGGGAEENVTPHYFRHFFTTHLRDRTGDRGIVKYLRGDVADDIIDTYTHNWGDRVREVYEANVYSLL